mmetsp:Transcript_14897/g.36220  ORF Transcript_14897/g.36220 Transcript_14897/m.36220 type:complete len:83 (+) Transcript_14897:1804-2052(+)
MCKYLRFLNSVILSKAMFFFVDHIGYNPECYLQLTIAQSRPGVPMIIGGLFVANILACFTNAMPPTKVIQVFGANLLHSWYI